MKLIGDRGKKAAQDVEGFPQVPGFQGIINLKSCILGFRLAAAGRCGNYMQVESLPDFKVRHVKQVRMLPTVI
jgi:hypothetical protein